MNVPFLDLKRQYLSIAPEIDAAVRGVIEGGQFILGPEVKALEGELARFCGAQWGVGVASGTDALLLALEALDIGDGDEVITTPFTFVATAEMISQAGATPVFADIEPDTCNLDPADVARKVTRRTKAIIPVHLYGHPADMTALNELARHHDLAVIEDAAQAIGAEHRGRRVGALGRVACFSFFPTKNLGAYGDGGFVTTDDEALAARIGRARQHGSRQKYIHESLGWSSRLDELQAAVLRVKLRHLEAWTERRRALARIYDARLADLPLQLPRERDSERAVYHLYTIRTPRREELQKFLAAQGIVTMVHYPMPLHRQPLYRDHAIAPLPNSEAASAEVLSLPLFPEMTAEEQEAVIHALRAFFGAPAA